MSVVNSSTGGNAVTTAQHVSVVEPMEAGVAMEVSGVPMEGDRVVRRSARLASLPTVCYKKFFGGRNNSRGRRRIRRRAAAQRRSRRIAGLEPVVVVQAEQRSRRIPEPQVVQLAQEHDDEAFDFEVEEEEEQPQMAMVVYSPPLLEQVTADLAVEQGRWVYCVFLETVEEEEEQPPMAMVVYSPPPTVTQLIAAAEAEAAAKAKAEAEAKAVKAEAEAAVKAKAEADAKAKAAKKEARRREKAMTMDKRDVQAIIDYSGGLFKAMNRFLRTGSLGDLPDCPKQTQMRCDDLQKALGKTKGKGKVKPFQGTVYRGVTGLEASLQVGESFQETAFCSTSTDREIAEEFSKGGILMVIKCKTGWNIQDVSKHPREKEILLRHGTHFQITSVYMEDSQRIVEMEELV